MDTDVNIVGNTFDPSGRQLPEIHERLNRRPINAEGLHIVGCSSNGSLILVGIDFMGTSIIDVDKLQVILCNKRGSP